MNKIVLTLAFLYVLTGCANSNDVRSATNTGNQQNAETAKAPSFAVTYKQVDTMELKQAESSPKGELVEIRKLEQAEIAAIVGRPMRIGW
ncbi:hypothetical protein [Paenibacillus macerans]|uniref:hypothetical protein n=1 Tax=Paenibacillus macerans TaxID=44252 RepID=UPI003D3183B6